MEILNYARSFSRLRRGWEIGRAATLGLGMALGNCLATAPPEQPIEEYQVKAAYLYNFAKFVEWPSEAFQSSIEPMAICILGPDPFGRLLDDTVAGRTIEGRAFIVRRISNARDAAGCHILFISAVQGRRSPPLLAELKTAGILTVGDSDTSGMDGVVINFKLDAGKVRFAINVGAAVHQKLRISSRLLNLSK